MKNLDRLLSELEDVELLRRLAELDVTYMFKHTLTQETAYQSVLVKKRREIHRRVAHSYEELYADDLDEYAALLAHHFAEAGDREKAIEYSRRAARRAQAVYAYDEAVQHLEKALDLIGADSGTTDHARTAIRMEVLEQLADVHRLIGDRVQAIPRYQEALELLPKLPGADALRVTAIRLYRKVAETVLGLTWNVELERFEVVARNSLARGLALTEGEPAHRETVRLLTTLSYEAWRLERPPKWDVAERHAQAAVEMARQLDSPVELSSALEALTWVYGARGSLRDSLDLSMQRLALTRDPRFDDVRERINILDWIGSALVDVGEYALALNYFRDAEKLAGQIQSLDQQVRILIGQAMCYFRMDRWDEVSGIDRRWRDLGEHYTLQQIGPICFYIALNATVHRLRGEVARANELKAESYEMMVTATPPERWGRAHHY